MSVLAVFLSEMFLMIASGRRSSKVGSPSLFFFFQAEDGIRDRNVTGVQTLLFRSPERLAAAMPSAVRTWRAAARRSGVGPKSSVATPLLLPAPRTAVFPARTKPSTVNFARRDRKSVV